MADERRAPSKRAKDKRSDAMLLGVFVETFVAALDARTRGDSLRRTYNACWRTLDVLESRGYIADDLHELGRRAHVLARRRAPGWPLRTIRPDMNRPERVAHV